ncbi:MAG TPA: acyltransferase, partial [Polyangiales bacterium]|nr:acyltransferase [Polyangiales bacterium]
AGTEVFGERIFRRFFSECDPAIVLGEQCYFDGVHMALGKRATLRVGNYVYAANMIILAEHEISIGNHVFIGFNVALADTDFHPLDPALRLQDAIAVSPIAAGRPRPPIATAPLIIEDDVWIGPNCAILKGVRIGAGAFIEPGSVVTKDVPARARVLGNPAQIIGQV